MTGRGQKKKITKAKNRNFRTSRGRGRAKNPYKSKSNRFINRGTLPVQLKPRMMGNRFSTYSKETKGGLSLMTEVPLANFAQVTSSVPAHPLFLPGRCFTSAITHSYFTLISSCIHWVPTRGTDEGGNLVISGLPQCMPVTQNSTIFNSNLTQIGASISPVWSPTVFHMPKDNRKYPIVPNVTTEIPYNYFLGCRDAEGAHAPNYYGDVYLEMELKFHDNGLHDNIASVAVPLVFTLAIAGITTTANTAATTKMIVTYSTVTNIDIGEFVIIPTITDFDAPALLDVMHNGILVNYAIDTGTITGLCFTEN